MAATPVAVESSAPVVVSLPTENVEIQDAPVSASLAVGLNVTYENVVSIEQQLVLGTLKLEDSDLAVSKEQADILVPLYTNLKTIMESMKPGYGEQGDSASVRPRMSVQKRRYRLMRSSKKFGSP